MDLSGIPISLIPISPFVKVDPMVHCDPDIAIVIDALVRVLFVLLRSCRWTIQAATMDCELWADGPTIQPEMMQSLNALLILVLIPLFDRALYPLVAATCGPRIAAHAVRILFCFVAGVEKLKNTKGRAGGAWAPVILIHIADGACLLSDRCTAWPRAWPSRA
jgi:hypothetical protein